MIRSYVFTFWDPFFASLGYGMTGTTIHEVGHHLGMSHPHDGYDAESNVDYGPSGVFYFAWAGDESHTVMAYTDLTREFGQFDRDNMNRYLTSSYLNQANQIIANVLASARASKGYAALGAAETLATQSVSAFAAFDYGLVAAKARAAYSQVLAAAVAANVRVDPQAYQADYKAKGLSPKFIDTVPYQRMQP